MTGQKRGVLEFVGEHYFSIGKCQGCLPEKKIFNTRTHAHGLSKRNEIKEIMNMCFMIKLFSETWILPLAVLFVAIVYTAMATVFYNRT